MPRPHSVLARLSAVLVIAAALLVVNELYRRLEIAELDHAGTSAETKGVAHVGAPFALEDLSGRTVTDAEFRGRHMLLIFADAADGDRTRAALQVASAAITGLTNGARDIAPVFISLPPSKASAAAGDQSVGSRSAATTADSAPAPDASTATRAIVSALPVAWTGLTGPAEKIRALARSYFVPLPDDAGVGAGAGAGAGERGFPPSGPPLAHLVDDRGTFVAATPIPTDPARLAEWLQKKL